MIRVTDPWNSPILARLKVWRERAAIRRFEDEKDVVLAMQTLGDIASYEERFGASLYYDECKAILRDKITRSKGGQERDRGVLSKRPPAKVVNGDWFYT